MRRSFVFFPSAVGEVKREREEEGRRKRERERAEEAVSGVKKS